MDGTMIPKIIHYCWFGGKPLPRLERQCVRSWRRVLPDYRIILWHEGNFDVNMNRYTKEAYAAKKYAFVADFARLYVLYNYGGVYLDTDVEMLKSLDRFLAHAAFIGCEDVEHISAGIMGACKQHSWIAALLQRYESRSFLGADGRYDTTTIVKTITQIAVQSGFTPNGKYQVLPGDIHIYPAAYFYPKSFKTNKLHLTEEACCIHHFAGSWLTPKERLKNALRQKLGDDIYGRILTIKNVLLAGGD